MSFVFNVNDVGNISGLRSSEDSDVPFLTPIFFDIKVLIKYFYDLDYKCEFHSETYGTIYCPSNNDEEFDSIFSFGINPNGKVIAWYGDLIELDPKEILYLKSHNIESDGNIESEFYKAQIGAEFTDSIKEVELILLKTKISTLTNELFGFQLYKTIEQSVPEIIAMCSQYKRIVFNSEDDMKIIYSTWNEDLIEDLNVIELKKNLTSEKTGKDSLKGLKGLKLLELFIKNTLNINENIVAPLFYLYDLRLWADHKNADKYYKDVVLKMEMKENESYKEIYEVLIDKIVGLFEKLIQSSLEIK